MRKYDDHHVISCFIFPPNCECLVMTGTFMHPGGHTNAEQQSSRSVTQKVLFRCYIFPLAGIDKLTWGCISHNSSSIELDLTFHHLKITYKIPTRSICAQIGCLKELGSTNDNCLSRNSHYTWHLCCYCVPSLGRTESQPNCRLDV